jgi:tetratricopeptide (TPR) repeat protein
MNDALLLHQTGRLDEAEAAYAKALADRPDDPDLRHGFGVLLSQRGELAKAMELIRSAIDLRPAAAAYYNSLGNVLQQQNLLPEAERQFRTAISLQPELAAAHVNLGNALRLMGRIEESLSAYQAALAIRPDHAATIVQLGIALLQAGRAAEAIPWLEKGLRLGPGLAAARTAYADALDRAGDYVKAEGEYRILTSLQPTRAELWCNLGRTLLAQGRRAEAVASLEEGIRHSPGLAELHYNLGLALLGDNQFAQAIACFERTVAIRADFSEGWIILGRVRLWSGDVEGAVISFKRALSLDPNDAEAHGALGLALLTKGDLQEGWAEYEWRWRAPSYQPMRTFPGALWDGKPLDEGQTLLLHSEQGFGDAIQFVRYARLLAQRGQRVIVECQRELVRLFQSLEGIPIYARNEALPEADAHCPMVSVPLRVGTTLENIPAEVPYLAAEPAAAAHWRERLATLPSGLRVGLVWAGNPGRKADDTRSLTLEQLSRLFTVPGVTWINLQKGTAGGQARPSDVVLHDFTSELADFADTAALVSNLDLIIAVDTAVAHLAGALAIPAWVLLPLGDVWRWMRDRSDSPWYPTLRLFRQTAPGDWNSVVDEVADTLRAKVARPAS